MSANVIEIGTLPRRTVRGRRETQWRHNGLNLRPWFVALAAAVAATGMAAAVASSPQAGGPCSIASIEAARCPAPSAAPAPVWLP